MTEIELRTNGQAPAVATAPAAVPMVPPPGSLMEWAAEARAAASIAESLARTSFAPKAFQGKPQEITAAILTGGEMGMSPMASLRSIHMIQGTPSLSAHAQRGVALGKGHRVWVEESTDKKAVVCGQRAGTDDVQRSTWTIARAEQAGLPNKNPNWKTQPQAMLVARASSEVCRLIAADALLGMPYTVEELQDSDGVPPQTSKGGKRQVASLAKKPEPEPADPWMDDAPGVSPDDSYDGSDEDAAEESGDTSWPEPAPIPGNEP